MKFWHRLRIRYKIVLPIAIVSILSGFYTYVHFSNHERELAMADMEHQAHVLVLAAESARNYVADQGKHKIFTDYTDSTKRYTEEQVLHSVPIFAAMQVTKAKADELGIKIRVPSSPKVDPRDPDNAPDAMQESVLNQFVANSRTQEIDTIIESSNTYHFFRRIDLSSDCLACHGDPATSAEHWGPRFSEGKDITGTMMENMSEGDLKGAFEIIYDLGPVEKAVQAEVNVILMIAAGTTLALILLAFLIAHIVGKPIVILEKAAKEFTDGNTDVQVDVKSEDELGTLANSFNAMTLAVNESMADAMRKNEAAEQAAFDADVSKKEVEAQQQYLSEKVDTMLAAMNHFASGNLDVHLDIDRKDEIGKLFEGFNGAVSNIRTVIGKVQEAADAVASASLEISASTDQIAAGASGQSERVMEIASAIEEMTATIMDTSRNASIAAETSESASNSAIHGAEKVSETRSGMDNIVTLTANTGKVVGSLTSKTEQIGKITQVIDEIADQTNLLALNAAIEAARAGEQGRGFAVVADEVRKLAERTTKATKEIAETIEAIQGEAVEANRSMEDASQAVNDGLRLTEEVESALNDILEGSRAVVDIIAQVAAASEEQHTTSSSISENVENISAVTQQSATGTQEIARTADDLSRLTENLQSVTSQFVLDTSGNSDRRLPSAGQQQLMSGEDDYA